MDDHTLAAACLCRYDPVFWLWVVNSNAIVASDGGRLLSCTYILLFSCESTYVTSFHLDGVESPSDIAKKAKEYG